MVLKFIQNFRFDSLAPWERVRVRAVRSGKFTAKACPHLSPLPEGEEVRKSVGSDNRRNKVFVVVLALSFVFFTQLTLAAQSPTEWEQTLAAARKEGIVVVGIPASTELRTLIGEKFKNKFGISIELLAARGPENVTRILTEYSAGVRYYDVLVAGGATPLPMIAAGAAEDFTQYMILPEVKDPKYWWGGHIWEDNVSTERYSYAFLCYTSETWWYNSSQADMNEARTYDDLLNPKWKGRIGLLDPRNPGSGQNTWSFIWKVKGEEYLAKLAQQDLLINQNLRQLADGLAKGKLAFTLGLSHYTYVPFIKAGLPVKPVSRIKEGAHANNGSGVVTVVKNPPHPNAAKIFVNWLLSKEGQELYGKAMTQGTRRLDVNTTWLKEAGIQGCKDVMTVDDYLRLETHLESSVKKIRGPAVALANKLLK
ncbi:MAG: extracellular solute-binding protein [Deltaproteobacteria bacterium]|nr:extracellular solute-binding protein [Deltaproteobacteria bacterium]MBM4297466.1 extracellular solute-binding protein [Deltaproteobacteria bacterium]